MSGAEPRRRFDRQPEDDHGPAPGLAGDGEAAPGLLGELAGHGEAKSRALALRLGGEEWLSRARKRCGVHADAGVRGRKPDVAAGRRPAGCGAACSVTMSAATARVSVPPCGMASRALVARFTITVSSSPRSATTGGRPDSVSMRSFRPGRPMVCASTSSKLSRSATVSTSSAPTTPRRAKASRRRVTETPRVAVSPTSSSRWRAPAGSWSRRLAARLTPPCTACRTLAKSWATPPASCPRVSSRFVCASRACAAARAAASSRSRVSSSTAKWRSEISLIARLATSRSVSTSSAVQARGAVSMAQSEPSTWPSTVASGIPR